MVVAAPAAGHADNIIPGDAGIAVQLHGADHGSAVGKHLDFHGAGSDAGLAKGAATTAEVQVGDACQCMVWRVQTDDLRFAGIRARMRAAQAVFGQWQILVPGRGWPQRVLPFLFTVTAGAGK